MFSTAGLPRLAAAILVFSCPLPSLAQSLPEPGTRVRAFAPITGTDGAEGVIESFSADTLRIRTTARPPKTLTIARDSLWRLETSAGKGSRMPGATIGAAAGAILSGASTMLVVRRIQSQNPDCETCVFGPTPDEARRWAAEDVRLKNRATMIAAVSGGLAGAWIGSRFRREFWQRVPVGNRFGIAPSTDGSVHIVMNVSVPRTVVQ